MLYCLFLICMHGIVVYYAMHVRLSDANKVYLLACLLTCLLCALVLRSFSTWLSLLAPIIFPFFYCYMNKQKHCTVHKTMELALEIGMKCRPNRDGNTINCMITMVSDKYLIKSLETQQVGL